jgi:DNA-binding GntR family transcriptional regulator
MKISVREVANARFVREAIECSITRVAARLATPADMARLRTLLVMQRDAAGRSDYWLFNEHDEAFHRAIADIVRCDYASRVVEGARIQTDRVRYLSLPDASPMRRLIGQHKTIVERLAAGDPDGAEAAMRCHLREILVALPQIASAHPDVFADTKLPSHTAGLVPVDEEPSLV